MKREHGIIIILVGIGLLFISIFFSSGSYHKFDFMTNLQIMEVVLDKGSVVPQKQEVPAGVSPEVAAAFPYIPPPVGKVAIPLKYLLSLSIILILLGTGIILLSKKRETNK